MYSLFPMHCPHLVNVNSKIFHNSVFFHYFLVILSYCTGSLCNNASSHDSSAIIDPLVLSSQHKSTFLQLKGRFKPKHAFMQLSMVVPGK